MGYRLSKIYTRTGDDGSTGLGDGSRIDKDHMRVEGCCESRCGHHPDTPYLQNVRPDHRRPCSAARPVSPRRRAKR